jgi:hypothetical protein
LAVGVVPHWQFDGVHFQEQSVGSFGLQIVEHDGASHASTHCFGGLLHA